MKRSLAEILFHSPIPQRQFRLSAVVIFLPLLLTGCGGGSGGGSQPAAVPALDRIVFQSTGGGDAEILVVNGDGSGPTALTANNAFDADPRFNAAGTKIVFTSNREGNSEIYVMDADGRNPVNVSKDAASDSDPAFSPDGRRIVFVSDRDRQGESLPSELEIYVLNLDGTPPRRLSNNNAFDGDPVFSPDGRKVLYSSNQDGNQEIYEVDAAGGVPRNLTRNPGQDRFPNFTPDGQILFVSDRTGNNEIFRMAPDGRDPVNLTNDPGLDTDPVVSPDGRRLIFSSGRGGALSLYTVPLAGGVPAGGVSPRRLTSLPGSERFPDVR